jgi:hypothetical protein
MQAVLVDACDAFSVISKPVTGPDSRNSGKLSSGFSRIKEAALSLSKMFATCWELILVG